MSSGCGDVVSLESMQIARKHQIFEIEVITGKSGGVAGGADIDYATNQVTDQTQKTLPAVLRDAGFSPVSWDFSTGGTLTTADRDKVVYDPVSKTWYSYAGTLPVTVPASFNPVGNADWKPQTDPDLRNDLASTTSGKGASLIGTTQGTTVQQQLSDLSVNAGFNAVGRFLNIAELRANAPSAAGVIVFVASAYSTSVAESHVGGGFFQSFDNTAALPDDGGIVIKPDHPTLAWKRINFTAYDMQFWGVIADGSTDNAAAITRATQYAKANRLILEAPIGNIHTSEMVPVYDNMGIRGTGTKAEGTVFGKTTNNAFPYKNGNTVVESIDALVGFVSKKTDRADFSMDSFCVHGRLENCMFRRVGLTQENVTTTRPYYGLFLGKSASPVIRQVSVEGGYIGIGAYVVFSGVMEMLSATQYNGYGYAGVSISDYRNSTLYSSGTSMDMRLVQVRGYQFGFQIGRLQYTTMTNCTAEEITPMSGETVCYAFDFTDPYSIVMNTCATEFVYGGQIRVSSFANPSFVRSLTVNGYLPIDQQASVSSTPIYYVDSGGVGSLKVTFIGGDLSRDTSKANNAAPVVSGNNAKVVIINAGGEDWTATASGVFTRLA